MEQRIFAGITIAILLLSSILLYFNDERTEDEEYYMGSNGLVPVWERGNQPFNTTGSYSYTLVKGEYNITGPNSIFVDVDLPTDEGGCVISNDCEIHMGLWLPDVPNGTKIPVIADIGPYYDDGDVDALTPANRLGKFLIENFVPYGYAVAQVSVFGTGESNHCMDFMGTSEQLGIDYAVTWLGSQEWSNGNVGIIGKSYDGSTPWQAAMFGNPYLKTIIPISGLIVGSLHIWRFPTFGPQLGHPETRPNPPQRVHTKPSPNPERSRQHAHNKTTTPNSAPRRNSARTRTERTPKPHQAHTACTPSPHEAHNAEDRQRTHAHTKPTRRQPPCARVGAK